MPGLCRKCAAHAVNSASHTRKECPFGPCACSPCRKIDAARSFHRNYARLRNGRLKAEMQQRKHFEAFSAQASTATTAQARAQDGQEQGHQRGHQQDGHQAAGAAALASPEQGRDFVVIPVVNLGSSTDSAAETLCTEYVVSERLSTSSRSSTSPRMSTSPAASLLAAGPSCSVSSKTAPPTSVSTLTAKSTPQYQRRCKQCHYHGLADAKVHVSSACPFRDCRCSARCVGLLEARAAKARWHQQLRAQPGAATGAAAAVASGTDAVLEDTGGRPEIANPPRPSVIAHTSLDDENAGDLKDTDECDAEEDTDSKGGVQDGAQSTAPPNAAPPAGVSCPHCSEVLRDDDDLQTHADVVHMRLLPLRRVHELAHLFQALSAEGAVDATPRED